MGRISWNGHIENRRIELISQGYKPTKISNILSNEFNIRVTRDMVNGRGRVVKNKGANNINQSISLPNDLQDNNKLFDNDMYNLKDKYINAEETKKELKKIWDIFNTPIPKNILNLSDLHAPYMDFKNIEKAITDNSDCNICVLNGDIFDGESMSVFEKMEEIDASKEFEQVFELLNVLSIRFEYVIWVGGNHDYQRFCRYIMKNIKPGLRKFAFDRLNPMKYISENYKNVITINHNMVEIGDVVFKHPNGYSGVEMKTVVNELDIITANKIDLPNANFRMIAIGHTHDMGEYIKNGIKLLETGCLCYTPDYRFNNPVKRKWTIGYARIELDKDNKVIFNKSHTVCLDD